MHREIDVEALNKTGVLSVSMPRWVCVAAVAIVLSMTNFASQPAATSRDLAGGVVGLVIAAVLLLVPMSVNAPMYPLDSGSTDPTVDTEVIGKVEARTLRTRWRQWKMWMSAPLLILIGALAALGLTGGWESPLALLLLLPALVLNTAVGERGVLIVVATVWLAVLTVGLIAGGPTTTQGHITRGIFVPMLWAAASALVYWLRVLLAERHSIVSAVRDQAEALRRESVAMRRSRGELLAHVSHELLTPLAAIQAGAGLLGQPGDIAEWSGVTRMDGPVALESGAAHRVALNIQRNVFRLTLLVEDLLESARIEEAAVPLYPARHACATALRSACEAVALLCESQCQHAVWSAHPAELTYWGDARRVDQVLVNLLANAHKYGGANATISLTARAWAGGVRWEVGDNGPQLGDDTLLHLFEQYYRAPELPIAGHGLGLTIAKTLVELHGGRIWAENDVGSGCRFIFWLPDGGQDGTRAACGEIVQQGDQR